MGLERHFYYASAFWGKGETVMVDRRTVTHTTTQQAADTTRSGVDTLARFGYITIGVVYALIGALAVMTAIGARGSIEDPQGAIRIIAVQPFGRILVGLTALGLLGFAIWRFVEAIMDPHRKGADAQGIVARIGYTVSGLIHAALALFAGRLALGVGSGGGESAQAWTATLLAQPFGPWLVGAIGGIIIGVGLGHFYTAYKARFMAEYNLRVMSAAEQRWAKRIGRFGLAARGVTCIIIGGFLTSAAVQADPQQTKGLDAALLMLAQQSYGSWLLGIVALGLVAYGVFCFSRARYCHFSL
jgi:hypothetical protein